MVAIAVGILISAAVINGLVSVTFVSFQGAGCRVQRLKPVSCTLHPSPPLTLLPEISFLDNVCESNQAQAR